MLNEYEPNPTLATFKYHQSGSWALLNQQDKSYILIMLIARSTEIKTKTKVTSVLVALV
jgi:hypothetical protein